MKRVKEKGERIYKFWEIEDTGEKGEPLMIMMKERGFIGALKGENDESSGRLRERRNSIKLDWLNKIYLWFE